MINKMYVKRWFDKINWNSYFNYYFEDKKGNRTDSKYNVNYWYGNVLSYIKDDKMKFTKGFEVIDFGYGLKRDMKNM